jgi:hypothetical protein
MVKFSAISLVLRASQITHGMCKKCDVKGESMDAFNEEFVILERQSKELKDESIRISFADQSLIW